VSDYAISVKVLNGRIRRKIAECGFKNVNELCRKAGLSPPQIGALLNLKVPPLTRTGTWRRSAAGLAEALGCSCEELFSETQRTLALRDNKGEYFLTEAAFLKLAGRVERPLLENPGERLLDDAEQQAKIAVVRRALDALKLTPRNRRILEGHFGIGCEERTLTELALEVGVSRQCAERSLSRTLQRLRNDKPARRRALLQAYQPATAMGLADEAYMRSARKRTALQLVEEREQAASTSAVEKRASASVGSAEEAKCGGSNEQALLQPVPPGMRGLRTLRSVGRLIESRRTPDLYQDQPLTVIGKVPKISGV
jgi:hypothetical protein